MRADLVLYNGNIHTMDKRLPHVEAVAIAGETILNIGSSEAMRGLLKEGGRAIDLRGRTVVPGLIDAHLHFLSYGLSLREVDLMNVPSLDAALDKVAAHVEARPPVNGSAAAAGTKCSGPTAAFPRVTIWTASPPNIRFSCAANVATPAGPIRERWRWPASLPQRPTHPAVKLARPTERSAQRHSQKLAMRLIFDLLQGTDP
ncbi:MAG: amidohydrolase family protein [Caldilineaceae bacterium]